MARSAHIDAGYLQLALVARRANPTCRWAVYSDCILSTRNCQREASRFDKFLPGISLLAPMHRGELARAIERMRLFEGLPAIRKTFGIGLRAILAETKRCVL